MKHREGYDASRRHGENVKRQTLLNEIHLPFQKSVNPTSDQSHMNPVPTVDVQPVKMYHTHDASTCTPIARVIDGPPTRQSTSTHTDAHLPTYPTQIPTALHLGLRPDRAARSCLREGTCVRHRAICPDQSLACCSYQRYKLEDASDDFRSDVLRRCCCWC
jgi:hypothetical protein